MVDEVPKYLEKAKAFSLRTTQGSTIALAIALIANLPGLRVF